MTIYTTTPTPLIKPTPFIDSLAQNYLMPILFLILGLLIAIIVSIIIYRKLIRGKFFTKQQKELMFKDFNVGKYAVVMYRRINDNFIEIDRMKLDIKPKEDTKFRYNNKDFTTFNINHTAFSDKHNNYYAFDYDTGSQLQFKAKNMPSSISIDDVDVYVNRHLIKDLVAGLEAPKNKGQWLMLIVGAVLGVGIGLVIGLELPKPKMLYEIAQLIGVLI